MLLALRATVSSQRGRCSPMNKSIRPMRFLGAKPTDAAPESGVSPSAGTHRHQTDALLDRRAVCKFHRPTFLPLPEAMACSGLRVTPALTTPLSVSSLSLPQAYSLRQPVSSSAEFQHAISPLPGGGSSRNRWRSRCTPPTDAPGARFCKWPSFLCASLKSRWQAPETQSDRISS